MIVGLTNRQFNGLTTRVFDPETGVAFPEDAHIDLDLYPFEKQQHFLRIVQDGDLVEVQVKTNKTNKQNKE